MAGKYLFQVRNPYLLVLAGLIYPLDLKSTEAAPSKS